MDSIGVLLIGDLGTVEELRRPAAAGIRNQHGPRNTPTIYTVAANPVQFWDGRSPSLEHQSLRPIESPIEMGSSIPAAIGYSLGESAGLFASGAWRDRDAMLLQMYDSTLFTDDLEFTTPSNGMVYTPLSEFYKMHKASLQDPKVWGVVRCFTPILKITGPDTATGNWAMEDVHIYPGTDPVPLQALGRLAGWHDE